LKRDYIKVNGLAVRCYEAGDGPPVLLVHGAGAQARLWRRLMGPMSSRFRVLAPDLPGFGGSDYCPDINKVRDFAGFLAGFLDAHGIGRASVVASSMGGWAASWFALDFPERVFKLVLISPAGLYSEEKPPMSVPQVISELREQYAKSALDIEGMNAGAEKELEKAVETINSMDARGGFAPDLAGRLGGIKAKTLIIWGSDDRVIPVSYADAFGDGIPGSTVSVMPGAGHLPYLDMPEEVFDLVAGFLEDADSKAEKGPSLLY